VGVCKSGGMFLRHLMKLMTGKKRPLAFASLYATLKQTCAFTNTKRMQPF
jgi:hypothetical protein